MAEIRNYLEAECAVFHRTRDPFGGFSNMAKGFGYQIGDLVMPSSEHHYQMSRYPDRPDIQERILAAGSPVEAKRKAYEYLRHTRKDWHKVNIAIMRHAIRLRYAFNRSSLGALYRDSGTRPIVEKSTRDDFWGAKPAAPGRLKGVNALGRLHMGHRQEIEADPGFCAAGVTAPELPDYRLLGVCVPDVRVPERGAASGFQSSLDL